MDDMTTFENRMAEDARRAAGPPHSVDTAVVLAAISTTHSPGWRFRSMFSATRIVVAGVIVALFGGFLLVSLPGERPASVMPAAATSGPTDVPSPAAVRVEVPEAGFRITVPAGWTFRLPYETDDDPAVAMFMDSPTEADVPFTQACHVLIPDPDEASSVDELATEDLAPVPAELVQIYGDAVAKRTDLSLPAGPTVRIDRSFDDAGASIYYLSDGERVRRLECAAERIVDDHWLSIVQTFEFMPVAEYPIDQAVRGSFTPTAELIASLATEEVEPGMLRVLDDGIDDGRGIDRPTTDFPSVFVDVTPDGGVWLSGGGGEDDLFRLGEPGAFEDTGAGSLEVGPDGALWALDIDIVRSFSNGVWTSWQLDDGLETRAIAIDRQGQPWVLVGEDNFGAEQLLTLLPDGTWGQIEVLPDLGSRDWRELASTPDGSLWLSGGHVRGADGHWTEPVVRFDGAEWAIVDAPGTIGTGGHYNLATGPGGELWRAWVDPLAMIDVDPDPAAEDLSGEWVGLARLDDGIWTTFGALDGVGSWGHQPSFFFGSRSLEVGPHGKVWVDAARRLFDCGGVASFDGVAWTPYLEGRCVHDLAVAPDGGLWLRANLDGWEGSVGTFVIPPSEDAGEAKSKGGTTSDETE